MNKLFIKPTDYTYFMAIFVNSAESREDSLPTWCPGQFTVADTFFFSDGCLGMKHKTYLCRYWTWNRYYSRAAIDTSRIILDLAVDLI